MTRTRLLLLGHLLAAALVALPAHADEYDEVGRLTQANQLTEALARADRFLGQRPRDPQMRFLKGVIQLNSGQRAQAIDTFTQLTQDAPELPEPYNNLAVIYAQQRDYDKARDTLERAVRANPEYSTAYENLGDVYASLASRAYGQALKRDARNLQISSKLEAVRTVFTAKPGSGAATTASAPAAAVIAVAPATTAPAAAPRTMPSSSAAAPAAPEAARPDTGGAAASADVETAVRAWATAWSGKDLAGYLAAYSPDFRPASGQSRSTWEQERRSRILGKSRIGVELRNLNVVVRGQTATASFQQIYSSDQVNETNAKTLELVRRNGGWVIAKEVATR